MRLKQFSFVILLLITFSVISCSRKSLTFNSSSLDDMVTVLPDKPGSICTFAADEFNKHLQLMYGKKLSIIRESDNDQHQYRIFIGIRPHGFDRKLKDEEAIYILNKDDLYIFGDDRIQIPSSSENPGYFEDPVLDEVLQMQFNRTGTLFALYNFLENEMGITWIKPGDDGIFYAQNPFIVLHEKKNFWTPAFIQRNMRSGKHRPGHNEYTPVEFSLTREQSIRKSADERIWLRRMKFGYSKYFQFSHAFTHYWDKYKDTNPGIFALNAKGKREPMGRTTRVKMCTSNPELVGLVINEWKKNKENKPYQHKGSISGCENDTDGFGDDEFCHCESCLALDTHKETEKLSDHLTDRYVHLWNAIVTEARKVQDDIRVTGYCYQEMLLPPRKIKLHPGLLMEFISRMGGDLAKTQDLFTGWRKMGMKMMFFRPNDLHWHIGIAMGQEERIFDHFKLAVKNKAEGTDYDSMVGCWEGVSDMTYFILTRAHIFPEASFEELENEFLHVFGDASEDIRAYYKHWRNIFNNKMIPADLELSNGVEPVYFEWHKMGKLTQRIDDFYAISDYDITDSYLTNALKKDIPEISRQYIMRMQIANQHSRLTFLSLLAGKNGDKEDIIKKAKQLVDFRIKNKDKIDVAWNRLFSNQHFHLYDQIGTRYLDYMIKNKKQEN